MDGAEKRIPRAVNHSVQRKLSIALLLSIAGVALAACVFSFSATYEEARELQDDLLRQVAQLASALPASQPPVISHTALSDEAEDARVIVQTLGSDKTSLVNVGENAPLRLPIPLKDGLYTLSTATADAERERFRVLIQSTRGGPRILVAQEEELRDAIARDNALLTVLPYLFLIPVLLLIVAYLVRQQFQPITTLAEKIDARSEQDLHAIDSRHTPQEVQPFILAINRLLARVETAVQTQQRFIAHAAHELRSPMTALSLQAEHLAQAPMSASAQERLATLRQGIERNRHLLQQLLSLAKAQAPALHAPQPLSVHAVFRRVLEDLMPLAQAKNIDLGVDESQDAPVTIDELDMTVMLKNLLDNAIRYTPAGGRVDVRCRILPTHIALQVQDNGPGIPPAERERVFAPFYRSLGQEEIGSGLGLAIVQTITARIGAQITLEDSDAQLHRGLRITVLLPSSLLASV